MFLRMRAFPFYPSTLTSFHMLYHSGDHKPPSIFETQLEAKKKMRRGIGKLTERTSIFENTVDKKTWNVSRGEFDFHYIVLLDFLRRFCVDNWKKSWRIYRFVIVGQSRVQKMVHRPPKELLRSKHCWQLSDSAMKAHRHQNDYLVTGQWYLNDAETTLRYTSMALKRLSRDF